jgi:hypothetical protein
MVRVESEFTAGTKAIIKSFELPRDPLPLIAHPTHFLLHTALEFSCSQSQHSHELWPNTSQRIQKFMIYDLDGSASSREVTMTNISSWRGCIIIPVGKLTDVWNILYFLMHFRFTCYLFHWIVYLVSKGIIILLIVSWKGSEGGKAAEINVNFPWICLHDLWKTVTKVWRKPVQMVSRFKPWP